MGWLRHRARGAGRGWVPSAPLPPVEPPPVEPPPGGDEGRGRHRGSGLRGWVRLPVTLTAARWQPGASAVLGVALVALLVALVLGLRVAWARDTSEGDVIAPAAAPSSTVAGLATGAVSAGVPSGAVTGDDLDPVAPSSVAAPATAPVAATGADGGQLVVHVVGRVRHPGVRRLPAGSRVADAVEAAGGASRGADLSAVNLARLLVDGEQVRVPRPGEAVSEPLAAPAPGATSGAQPAAPVSLSTADLTTLDTLPGIGPVLAQRIVDWRTENGQFTSVDEVVEVSGIGEKLLEQLRPLVVP
ncbi:ComEA family DNA-binding protein [Phycicoccus endophyticus]|uniref:ComEA family DNA-binding protein n=2 Tax=Phycicoccus endophyticus TaxID=1690220 RepID=A0A7G9R5V3_9MICO|nr:ComEA family DNA-binding protein [Phycicoccus endophyticus]